LKNTSYKTICININDWDSADGRDIEYIGRPSDWGNPFKIGRDGNRAECIKKYRDYIDGRKDLLKKIHELKGKALACHCKPMACHGDVLVEILESDTWKLFFEEEK
jgi:hypothetical protein